MRALLVAILALVGLAVAATPAPDGKTTITVQFTIRDVVGVYSGNPPSHANKTTHRDFERINQAETGVVLKRLGSDRKPVFNTGRVSATWTNQTLFDYVWRDVPGVTFTLIRNFDLKWNVNTALYEYSNSSFFPIDNAGFGNYGSTGHNFHFCLEYHTQFQYRGVETFSFTGDDDVYFFVNNILFVDLGGVHGAQSTTKDLRNPTVAKDTYEMDVGGIYNFDLFYCERHTSASNLKMATNIQLNNCPYLDQCGLCSLTAPLTTVNPCATMNCNNGVCDCPTSTCICNDGWVDAPPTGGNPNYCSQKCGDGILQGDEQCDPPSACCSATCKFAAAGTTCPSSGQPCVQSVCPGTSAKCGVAYPIGTLCNGGNTAPACKQYQCTDASGSTCALVNNNTLTCSDNNACTTDTCSNGVCVSSTTSTCPSTNCRNAGTCDATTGQCSVGTAKANGIGCGADPGLSFCVQPTCQSGTCTNTSKPAGTSCGSDTANKCGTSRCDGNGACAIVPIVSATGTVANCPAQVDGMCTRQICDPNGSMACVTQNLQDGSTCSNASLTPTSCQRFACSSGVCGLVSINEGNTCSDGAALNTYGNDACSKKICQSGACVIVANTSRNTESCDISSGANPELECREYKCNAGTCTSSNINERGTCTVGGTIDTPECQERRCVAGTCTVLSANAGSECDESENMGCKIWRCAAGACVSSSTAVNVPCDATNNKCNLKFCDGAGACVARPVVCDPDQCFGNLECQPATGICVAPSGGVCCGNDVLDDGEECDDSTNPCCVNCAYLAADSLCGSDTCIEQTCQNVTNGEPQKTTCVSDADIRNGVACTNGPPVTNQCQELRCQSGTCAPQNKPNSESCNLSGTGFCNLAACIDGTCSIVPNAAVANADCSSAYGTVPECNSAVCSGTQCVLVSASESLPCTAINSTTCSDRVCKSGQCIYNYDAYPKSPNDLCSALATTNLCLLPGCDGSGGCILLNATAGTACNIPSNPECNLPQCDGGGVCVLNANPAKIGQACTTARDLQCQVAKCDINGDCAVENVVDGTACVRTDVGECQDSMCQTGACVLVNTADTARVCTATSAPAPGEDRSCSNYFCQADGSCNTPSPKAAGTLCPDLNLCDVDVCNDAGVCVHTPSKQCDQPTQPCEVPLGICLSAYGNCTYGGRGQYASCTPRASELDQRCNASEVGAYRCATGAPDSPCVPSCFAGGVCGDGIVQAGEQCDWGDERTGGPCCNITCQWFAEQTPCNNTDATILAAQTEQAANLSKAADLPLYCFNTRCFFASSGKSVCTLGFDETVNKKCQPDDSGSSNRTAILASVIPGTLLALLLAGAGFFFWRRAQKAAEGEWLQEYLNAGNVRVENNAAFVETQTNVNNAAFQPDGSN